MVLMEEMPIQNSFVIQDLLHLLLMDSTQILINQYSKHNPLISDGINIVYQFPISYLKHHDASTFILLRFPFTSNCKTVIFNLKFGVQLFDGKHGCVSVVDPVCIFE